MDSLSLLIFLNKIEAIKSKYSLTTNDELIAHFIDVDNALSQIRILRNVKTTQDLVKAIVVLSQQLVAKRESTK